MTKIIEEIRDGYADCMTQSCKEGRCSLRLDDVDPASLAIISGTEYQKTKSFTDKLCDRILFCGERGLILAAVELKGGKNVDMSAAIKQIQNGLSVADAILGKHTVSDWYPLLLYSGSVGANGTRLLKNKSVKFKLERKNVMKLGCGTSLSSILSD